MRFDDLPVIGDTSERHAWEVFGHGDELGTLNRLTPERVRAAAKLVTAGRTINVNLPLDEPGPLAEGRVPYRHEVVVERFGRDERLDAFFPQGSTQWDGWRHVRFRQFGYYGGRQEADLDASDVIGIDGAAVHGIVGRGVLLDVAAHVASEGRPWPVDEANEVTVELLEAVAERQGVTLQHGDVLLIRTGWLGWFLSLPPAGRVRVGTAGTMASVGLEPTRRAARWLWDHGVAAVACDNLAVEVLPIEPARGFLHHRLIALLGMPLGELWHLDPLAEDCARDGRYEGLLVSAPLRLPGGAGSPANAYVVK